MKDLFQRLFGVSPIPKLRSNRKLSAILFSVLVALVLWFLIALSKEYVTTSRFPVLYTNFPGQNVLINELPGEVSLTMKTSGYNILSMGFQERQTLVFDVENILLTSGTKTHRGYAAVATSELAADITRQLGDVMSILSLSPDSLVFNFGKKLTRKVPVRTDLHLSFAKQYDSSASSYLEPSSIEISGPESVVTSIHFLNTGRQRAENIKSDVKMKLNLLIPAGVTANTSEVLFTLPVEKFTEGNLEAPVSVYNVRNGYDVKTFPDKVKIRYTVPLSKYSQVKPELFDVRANADRADVTGEKKLSVEILKRPEFVRSLEIEPSKIEFILRKK